jgi:bifunctional DNA-binding transcriptional regulator/antitoxin component of YhaV-PrlF toxin-antitoxin module
MVMAKLHKISKGGQISVPAPVRKRWGTESVLVEDHGDALVVRPVPDDPIEAAYGALSRSAGPSGEAVRREERKADAEIDERKYGT